jgi:rubrerythrin
MHNLHGGLANMKCLRCEGEMKFVLKEKIQLGQMGLLLGDIPHLMSGALHVNVYVCKKCRKMEFFDAGTDFEGISDEELPQKTCPRCGERHDFDYPKCPVCGYDYYAK